MVKHNYPTYVYPVITLLTHANAFPCMTSYLYLCLQKIIPFSLAYPFLGLFISMFILDSHVYILAYLYSPPLLDYVAIV